LNSHFLLEIIIFNTAKYVVGVPLKSPCAMGLPFHLPLTRTEKHVFLTAPLFHFSIDIAKKNPVTVALLFHQSSVKDKDKWFLWRFITTKVL